MAVDLLFPAKEPRYPISRLAGCGLLIPVFQGFVNGCEQFIATNNCQRLQWQAFGVVNLKPINSLLADHCLLAFVADDLQFVIEMNVHARKLLCQRANAIGHLRAGDRKRLQGLRLQDFGVIVGKRLAVLQFLDDAIAFVGNAFGREFPKVWRLNEAFAHNV